MTIWSALLQASAKNDLAKLDEVLTLLRSVKGGMAFGKRLLVSRPLADQ